jgi:hypothetical protein
VSTPSTTFPQSFIHERIDPWLYRSNLYTTRFKEAKVTLNVSGHIAKNYVGALLPFIKDDIRSIECYRLISSEMGHPELGRGMLLSDARGNILIFISSIDIIYEDPSQPSLARDILEMLGLPKSVYQTLVTAANDTHMPYGVYWVSYGVKVSFA